MGNSKEALRINAFFSKKTNRVVPTWMLYELFGEMQGRRMPTSVLSLRMHTAVG